jgi:hypothetical protein
MGAEGFIAMIDAVDARVEAEKTHACVKGVEFLRPFVVEQTPVDTGHLRSSEEPRPTAEGAELFIPGPYARRQHYELTWNHPRGGNALYLELPWMAHGQEALAVVAAELKKVM